MTNPIQNFRTVSPFLRTTESPSVEVIDRNSSPTVARTDQVAKEKLPLVVACFVNKGGVGKTTATLQIGYILSQELGLRTLLVDGDFQTSLTALIEGESNFTSRIPDFYAEHEKKFKDERKRINMAQVFREPLSQRQFSEDGREADEVELTRVRKKGDKDQKETYYNNLYYIPGHATINDMDHEIELGFGRIGLYRELPGSVTNLLRKIGKKNNIDLIMIDLSPSGSGFNKAVLWGCDYFFAPYFLEHLSIHSLQTLRSSLEKGIRLYRNNPTHDFSDLKDKEMGAMACEPKFLGAFPQNVPLRAPKGMAERKKRKADEVRPHRKPNKTQQGQFEKATSYLKGIEETLKTHQLAASHFQFSQNPMISRMASSYIEAQRLGAVVIDLSVPIRLSSGKKEIKSRDIYLKEFRKLTGCLLLNMLPEDLVSLEKSASLRGWSALQQKVRDFSNIFTIFSPSTTASSSQANMEITLLDREEDYSDDDIRTLANYYVRTGLNPERSRVWPHLHIGSHRGNAIGGEVTVEGIAHRLRDEKNAFLANNQTHFYLPIGIGNSSYSDASGGGHWTLLYGIFTPSGVHLNYFDPLGNPMPDLLRRALGTPDLFPPGTVWNEMGSPRIQGNDNNCGPWIVEVIRRLVQNQGIPDVNEAQNIDIHQVRQAQQAILRTENRRAQADSRYSTRRKKQRVA